MKKTLLILIIALCAQMTLAQRSSRTSGFGTPPPPGPPTTISSFLPATICTLGQYEITIEGTGLNQVTSVLFTGATGVNLVGTITAQSDTSLTVTTPTNIVDGVISLLYPDGSVASSSILTVITPTTTPTFTQLAAIYPGATIANLPTTSTNGITGTWSPAINNLTTTEYTFTPAEGQCGTTATLTIVVIDLPTPTASAQTFCGSATVANLVATGTDIKWYDFANGGTALASTTALATRTYYVSQTINGQESARTAVDVAVVVMSKRPLLPPGLSTNYFCNSATIADLVEATEWYASATGGAILDPSTPLTTETYYYYPRLCYPDYRLSTYVIITLPTPPEAIAQTFCASATVANLAGTGTNLKWYTTATGGTVLGSSDALASGTYYVSQTINGCESERTSVAVTINPELSYYADADGDGYGIEPLITACVAGIPAGYSLLLGDCDDTNASIHPTATETINGIDDNCNGTIDEVNPDAFITTWVTDVANETLTLPAQTDAPNYTIDWGDGSTTDTFTASDTPSHTYSNSGEHTVSFTGTFPHLTFSGQTKLKAVQQWGTQKWTSMANMFQGCTTFNSFPTQAPDLSLCNNLSSMFLGATAFNQPLESWNVSNVIDMHDMFSGATTFNQPLGSWDVSNVTNMYGMFFSTPFNQPLESWNVSNVINMYAMFTNATTFNQPLGSWDVSNVTNMSYMFYGTAFNQPIEAWDVSKVTDMNNMFVGVTTFNQPLGSWNVSSVSNMYAMFAGATAFNQPLGSWDVSNVTNMSLMFYNAKLSTVNYDATLIGWATRGTNGGVLKSGVNFDGGSSNYCNGSDARNFLINTYGWNITDAGADCITSPTATAQTFCGLATVANLVATGTDLKWYATAVGGTVLVSSDALVSGTYYVSQTINGYESEKTAVEITINESSTPTFSQVAAVCSGAVIEALPTTSTNGITGIWSPPINNLATTDYTFTPNEGQCGTTATQTIVVNVTPTPTAEAQNFCADATVASLVASGTDLKWYATATDETALESGKALTTGTYYASQTINSCESERTSVPVTINPELSYYADADGDGYGIEPLVTTCVASVPSGYSLLSGDCDDNNASIQLGYPYYLDQDGDGYGSSQIVYSCFAEPPVGMSLNNTDSDDTNAAVHILNPLYFGSVQTYDVNTGDTSHAGSTYAWNITPAASAAIITGDGSNSISIDWGTTPLGIYTVQVTETSSTGCVSSPVLMTTTIIEAPAVAPTAPVNQIFCSEATVANLTASGTAIQWYTQQRGGTALASTTPLTTGTYYASQTLSDYETLRTSVAVSINDPQITASATTVCSGTAVTITAASAGTSTLPANLQNGLVGYWPFNGNANDESGNSNNGTVNGATLTADRFGNTNSAYNFDGNDFISTNVTRGNLGSSFSISVNFKYEGYINAAVSAILGGSDVNGTEWFIGKSWYSGNLGIQDGNYNDSAVVNTNAFDSKWHNLMISNSTGLASIYIDGTLQSQSFFSGCDSSELILFGLEAENAGYYFQGKIDDISMYNRALSISEITQLYNQGEPTYAWSTGETTATINPIPTETTTYWCDVTTNGTTCRKEITISVTLTVATTFASVEPICARAFLDALPTTSTNGIIGTWSPAINNLSTTDYTFTPNEGQCGTTASQTIVVNVTPTPTAEAQTFCASATVANIVATGTDLKWYATATDEIALVSATALTTGTYYVTQTINGCESERVSIAVAINPELSYYADADGDGYGIGATITDCVASVPSGYSLLSGDCDDTNASIQLGYPYYLDQDGDGYGSSQIVYFCTSETPVGYSINNTDGDDTNPAVYLMNPLYFGSVQTYDVNTGDISHTGSTYAWSITPAASTAIITGDGSNSISIDWGTTPLGIYTIQVTETSSTGCVSSTVSMTTTIIEVPAVAPSAPANQSFCGSATVASLVATGTDLKWYPAPTGGTALTSDVALASGTYYVSQTINGYESEKTATEITINESITPTFSQITPVCSGSAIAALPTTSINGFTGIWSPAVNNLATTEYTFTPDAEQCATTTTQTIEVITIPAPIAANQTYCAGATVGTLTATGTALKWYPQATEGLTVSSATLLTTGTYYVSQTLNGCESNKTAVAVNIGGEITEQPENATICMSKGAQAKFSVVAPYSNATYQWETQSATDTGTNGWVAVSNSFNYAGATTASLTITKSTPTFPGTGRKYRVKVTSNSCSVTSDVATLTDADLPGPVSTITASDLNICKYIGTENELMFTATTGANQTFAWTVPPGVTLVPGQEDNGILTVNLSAITPNSRAPLGVISVKAVSDLGCLSAAAKTLVLTPQLPKTPLKLVLTSEDDALNSLTAITRVGPYVGTQKEFILTATEDLSQGATASSFKWVLPKGVYLTSPTFISNTLDETGNTRIVFTQENTISIDFRDVSPGVGTLIISVYASGGCGLSNAKTLNLTKVLPTKPAALVLSNGEISSTAITKVGSYMGTSRVFTLTASPITIQGFEATTFKWILPFGVHATSTHVFDATVVNGVTTLFSEESEITIDFSEVPPGIGTLPVSVAAVNGTGTSLVRTLALTRALPTVPSSLNLSLVNSATGITTISDYVGTDEVFTITATPVTTQGFEATQYKWILPVGVTVDSEGVISNDVNALNGLTRTVVSTNAVLFLNFKNVASGITSLPISVYAMNGSGTSATARVLVLKSAKPATPGSISGSVTFSTACSNAVLYSVENVAGVTYEWTIPNGASIEGQGGSSVIVDFTNAVAATSYKISVVAKNGTGMSASRTITLTKGDCAIAKELITPNAKPIVIFAATAYPNPSSSVFEVTTNTEKPFDLSVYDMLGRLIEQRHTQDNTITIGAGYPSGTYTILVSQGENLKTLRVIKR